MAVAPLLAIQGLTALRPSWGTVALLYLPCLSVFSILAKFNAKVAVAIGVSTAISALLVAGIINQVAQLFI